MKAAPINPSAWTIVNLGDRNIQASVNWLCGWANDPELRIRDPKAKPADPMDPVWNLEPDGLVWTQQGPYIEYLVMNPPSANRPAIFRGFGGRTFHRKLTDGTIIESDDCWSSRASCLPIPCTEIKLNGFGPSVAMELDIFTAIIHRLGFYVVPNWENRPVAISLEPGTKVVKPEKPTEEYPT